MTKIISIKYIKFTIIIIVISIITGCATTPPQKKHTAFPPIVRMPKNTPKKVATIIRKLLKSYHNDSVKHVLTLQLKRIGKPAVMAIFRLIDHSSWYVRMVARETLITLDNPAKEVLLKLVSDGNARTQRYAASVLGKMGSEVVEPLITLFENNHSASKKYIIAYELGTLRDKRAIEPLIRALGNKDNILVMNAAEALAKIGDTRAVMPLLKCDTSDENVRLIVCGALGKIGEAVVAPLTDALLSDDVNVRANAAFALGRITEPLSLKPTVVFKKKGKRFIRIFYSFSTKSVKSPKAVQPLMKALKDPSPKVRAYSADALGMLKDSRALSALVDALADTDWKTSNAAAIALGRITQKSYGKNQQKWRKWLKKIRNTKPQKAF